MEGVTFSWPTRVYYEDTDAGGVVYHAQYLKFLERARTEWLRAAGLEQDRLAAEHGIVFAVTQADLRFVAPARFNDALCITVRPVAHGRVRIVFEQAVYKADATDEPLVTAHVEVACVSRERFRAAALPEFIVETLKL
ncbi:MAG: tol-pal system-associated acyl-CoA thioesterase [Gammaproteobacteria bacterium]|nr:tol-pal system-associated acyl-CoA thioesterase [Gammaproteobacteria bacterium]